MKITIEKVYNPINDEYYFYLIVDEPYYTKAFGFKPDAPEGDIYNEKANYEQALEIALRIEKTGSPAPIKEVVYEKNVPEWRSGKFEPEIPSKKEIDREIEDAYKQYCEGKKEISEEPLTMEQWQELNNA